MQAPPPSIINRAPPHIIGDGMLVFQFKRVVRTAEVESSSITEAKASYSQGKLILDLKMDKPMDILISLFKKATNENIYTSPRITIGANDYNAKTGYYHYEFDLSIYPSDYTFTVRPYSTGEAGVSGDLIVYSALIEGLSVKFDGANFLLKFKSNFDQTIQIFASDLAGRYVSPAVSQSFPNGYADISLPLNSDYQIASGAYIIGLFSNQDTGRAQSILIILDKDKIAEFISK